MQVSYGPQFLKLGPFASDVREVAQRFAQVGSVDPAGAGGGGWQELLLEAV